MAEEMSQASPGIFLGIYVHVYLALSAVAAFGTEAQKEAYLRPGIAGDKIGAWGFAEPDAGSDPGGMKTRATRDGDSYLVNGSKILITNGDIADFIVVTTVTAPDQGMRGLSLIIVDRDSPGFSARRLQTMGMRAAHTAELAFQDCRVPADQLLGAENTGFTSALRTPTQGRVVARAGLPGGVVGGHRGRRVDGRRSDDPEPDRAGAQAGANPGKVRRRGGLADGPRRPVAGRTAGPRLAPIERPAPCCIARRAGQAGADLAGIGANIGDGVGDHRLRRPAGTGKHGDRRDPQQHPHPKPPRPRHRPQV